jgi:hypothetical protein
VWGAPECMPASGAPTFPTVFKTSRALDTNEKTVGVSRRIRYLSGVLNVS